LRGRGAVYRDDPRFSVVGHRLSTIDRIIVVASPKGGVGKTLVSTLAALAAAGKGLEAGLLDLDLTNPCTHVVLGVDPGLALVEEEKGVVPPRVHGVSYMTIAFFTGGRGLALRGPEATNVILEVLAVTRWPRLNILFVDTPPGIRDEVLDVLNIASSVHRDTRVLVVTTPSRLAVEAAGRLLDVLRDGGFNVAGLVENMARPGGSPVDELAAAKGVDVLARIPYDPSVEEHLGNPSALLKTRAGRAVEQLLGKLF